VRYVNDTIAKQVSMYPSRFGGAVALPQDAKAPDLAHVIPEVERCVSEYGFIAVYASPDPTGDRDSPGMHEPYWFPLYEHCQANGLPIIVHGTNARDPRYRVVPQNYQLGFYTEQYLATQFLSHGDVFERYPELKVVVCHCGGGLDRFIPSDAHIAQKDLSKNLFFDSCAYDVNFLEAAIKQRTPDRMCFGTEAPGSGRAVRPENGVPGDNLVPVISAMEFLSEEDKLKIFHHTPMKVFPAFANIQ
jgi:predicted TIM-barrel fold metal-dependent hydrolase